MGRFGIFKEEDLFLNMEDLDVESFESNLDKIKSILHDLILTIGDWVTNHGGNSCQVIDLHDVQSQAFILLVDVLKSVAFVDVGKIFILGFVDLYSSLLENNMNLQFGDEQHMIFDRGWCLPSFGCPFHLFFCHGNHFFLNGEEPAAALVHAVGKTPAVWEQDAGETAATREPESVACHLQFDKEAEAEDSGLKGHVIYYSARDVKQIDSEIDVAQDQMPTRFMQVPINGNGTTARSQTTDEKDKTSAQNFEDLVVDGKHLDAEMVHGLEIQDVKHKEHSQTTIGNNEDSNGVENGKEGKMQNRFCWNPWRFWRIQGESSGSLEWGPRQRLGRTQGPCSASYQQNRCRPAGQL